MADVEKRLDIVEQRTEALEKGQAKIEADVSSIKATIGEPPDRSTGKPGSGMAKVISQMGVWLDDEDRRRATPMKWARSVVTILPLLAALVAFSLWLGSRIEWVSP